MGPKEMDDVASSLKIKKLHLMQTNSAGKIYSLKPNLLNSPPALHVACYYWTKLWKKQFSY